MPNQSATRACPTCGDDRDESEFYETSVECRECKRERSRQNRQLTAQKVQLADRLLDIVGHLAVEGWLRELTFSVTKQGPASDCSAARPLSESLETQL